MQSLRPDITDFHTHNLQAQHAIINVPQEWILTPSLFLPCEGAYYSVGIHPWWTAEADAVRRMLDNLPALLEHPQVVALGECGLDALQGAPLDEQERIFTNQIAFAEAYHLPVTLHIVRAFDRLLRLKKQLRPTTQWTVHGFRGKPALAQQLLRAGIDLSFGVKYNDESWRITPPNRRRRETDEDF